MLQHRHVQSNTLLFLEQCYCIRIPRAILQHCHWPEQCAIRRLTGIYMCYDIWIFAVNENIYDLPPISKQSTFINKTRAVSWYLIWNILLLLADAVTKSGSFNQLFCLLKNMFQNMYCNYWQTLHIFPVMHLQSLQRWIISLSY